MNNKFNVGDTVLVQIGNRPTLNLKVLNIVMREEKAHYYLDWAGAGWHHLLSTVAIPESTIKNPQEVSLGG